MIKAEPAGFFSGSRVSGVGGENGWGEFNIWENIPVRFLFFFSLLLLGWVMSLRENRVNLIDLEVKGVIFNYLASGEYYFVEIGGN